MSPTAADSDGAAVGVDSVGAVVDGGGGAGAVVAGGGVGGGVAPAFGSGFEGTERYKAVAS